MIRSTGKYHFACRILFALALGVGLVGLPHAASAQDAAAKGTLEDAAAVKGTLEDAAAVKETLADATGGLASDLASSLKANAQSEVVLGQINVQSQVAAGQKKVAGVENTVALPLAKALEAQKIKIVPESFSASKWRITGEARAETLDNGGVHVAIECKLKPPVGPVRKILRYTVTSPDDIRKLTGQTGTVPVGDAKEKSTKLADDLKKGGEFVAKENGKVLSAATSSEFAIELLVQRGGKGPYEPLGVIAANGQPKQGVIAGQPQVDLKPTDNYAIRVQNQSQRGAGVEIDIDGINMFQFCDDMPEWKRLGKMYFHPGQAATISGWCFPRNQTRKFTVVNEQDGLHQRLGRPRSSVGFITVRFCAAWSDAEKPPADEVEFSRDAVATGAGEVDAKAAGYKAADTPKIFGVTRSQISVRYSRPTDLPPPADLPKP